jgi:hypothetical protein
MCSEQLLHTVMRWHTSLIILLKANHARASTSSRTPTRAGHPVSPSSTAKQRSDLSYIKGVLMFQTLSTQCDDITLCTQQAPLNLPINISISKSQLSHTFPN